MDDSGLVRELGEDLKRDLRCRDAIDTLKESSVLQNQGNESGGRQHQIHVTSGEICNHKKRGQKKKNSKREKKEVDLKKKIGEADRFSGRAETRHSGGTYLLSDVRAGLR